MSDDRRLRRWQLSRLQALVGRLPKAWEVRRQELVGEFGEPAIDDRPVMVSSWVGPTSPWTPEVVGAWTPEQLVRELQSWSPNSGWAEPTPEGAGRLVAEVVKENPGPYAEYALAFRDLEATYVRALLGGLENAAKADRGFAWGPVLELCEWTGQQQDPASPGTVDGDRDPHWRWARRQIAALLSVGLERQEVEMPQHLRPRIWTILRPLTEDPEPTPEFERRFGGDNMDPMTMSINTTRGEAMHTLMRYWLWLYRAATKEPATAQWAGFGAEPDARAILDRHLDIAIDPALAIRAVYGQWLPWLVLLDPEWTKGVLSALFPNAPELGAHRDAAWDTYVSANRLYRNVFELTREEYLRAVESVGHVRSTRPALREDPDESLAEHVLVAYLQGWIAIDDPLLTVLFSRAPEKIRAHAIEFVGRAFGQDEPLTGEFRERAQTVWLWRVDHGAEATELEAFGWWYFPGTIGEDWALGQLRIVLERTAGRVDMDHEVAERLAASDAPISERLRAFDLMVQGAPSNSWEIGGWARPLEAVLRAALEEGATRATAKAVVARLIAKGYPNFHRVLTT